MNNKLEKIISSTTPNPKDENKFGGRIVEIIKKSEGLHDPKNNYAYLKEFLKDHIAFLAQEITYTAKYSPTVYHENVSKSRIFEKEVCEKILEALNKL